MLVRRAFALLFAAFLASAGTLHAHAAAAGADAPCAACTLRAASDVATAFDGLELPAGDGFTLSLPSAPLLESRAVEGAVFETGPPAIG